MKIAKIKSTLTCGECDLAFSRADHLKKHVFAHTIKELSLKRNLFCDQCDHKAYTKRNISRHKLIHQKSPIVRFTCDQCTSSSTYASRNSLRRHQKIQHEGMLFKCNFCTFQTGYTDKLEVHKQLVHQGQKHDCP